MSLFLLLKLITDPFWYLAKGGKKSASKKDKSSKVKEESKDQGRKPPKAIGAYIYFNTATTKRLKEEEGLSHKEAFSKAG